MEFSKDRQTGDGLAVYCRACNKARHAARYQADKPRRQAVARAQHHADPAQSKVKNRERYLRDPEKVKRQVRAFQAANPDKLKAYASTSYRRNPEGYAERSAWRRTELLQATPKWVDRKAINALYREARRLTRETGVRHEVDHVYPLQHSDCCGLHVLCNLQILTRFENRSKGNRLPPDQSALT